MFEKKDEPLAPLIVFFTRVMLSFMVAALIIGSAICIGMMGFYHLEGMPWLNGFLNSAMILSTMGPVVPVTTASAKIFASFYALFSGLIFVTTVGVLLAPIVHRFLHHFHTGATSGSEIHRSQADKSL